MYSRPSDQCVGCYATELMFKSEGIPVEKIMLDESPGAMEYVRSLGYTSAPVVVVERDGVVVDHWSQFRQDKIKALKGSKVA